MDEHGDFLNRIMFNEAGYQATCASCSTATFTLATGTNMNQWYIGQKVDIRLKSDGTEDDGKLGTTISAIDKSAYTITTADAPTSAAGIDSTHGVCTAGAVETSGTTVYLPHGLPTLIGTGTLHGVNTSTYPEFKSVVHDISSAEVELDDIQYVIDEIELHSHGKLGAIWMSDDLYRRIQFKIIEPQTYRTPGEGLAGTGPIAYRGRSKQTLPIYVLSYCHPANAMYFLDYSAIDIYHAAWMEWANEDGSYLHKVSGYRIYECSLGTELQTMVRYRMRLGKITSAKIA
jgi:hypothetical protein